MSPRYTAVVRQYWTRYRPAATSQLPNPEAFFERLGTQIEAEVSDLTARMQGPDWPGETYLDKVGRLNSARSRAEEQVLADLLYSQPPELSPNEELEELLAQLPSPEIIEQDLDQIELDALTQAEADDSTTVALTVEQAEQKAWLQRLLPLVQVSSEDLDSMDPQEAAARIQALRPFLSAMTQQ